MSVPAPAPQLVRLADLAPLPQVAANTSLTPDALMAFLEVQLQGNDSQTAQIQDHMQQQQDLGTALNNLSSQLNKYPSGIGSGDTGTYKPANQAETDSIRNATDASYDAAISAAGGMNTSEGAQLFASKQKFDESFGTDGNTSPTPSQYPTGSNGKDVKGADNDLAAAEVSNLGQDVKTIQSGMNTESQMDMIQLQSLVSQRQTFIQLATNMMQSLNDGTKSIVTNVGH